MYIKNMYNIYYKYIHIKFAKPALCLSEPQILFKDREKMIGRKT